MKIEKRKTKKTNIYKLNSLEIKYHIAIQSFTFDLILHYEKVNKLWDIFTKKKGLIYYSYETVLFL